MPRRVVVTGAGGQLGRRLAEVFSLAGDEALALTHAELELASGAGLSRIRAWHPDVVVNAAAWTDVDGCARDPERARVVNGNGAGALARAAAAAGALVVQVSTNEVFDGAAARPYHEDDAPNPINPYGASKLLGEQLVAKATGHHLIVRTAWLYDAERMSGFPSRIRGAAERSHAEGRPLRVVDDEWGNPTPVAWLASAIHALVNMDVRGVIHAAGEPATTRWEWAAHVLRGSGRRIERMRLADFQRASRVPRRAVLDVSRLRSLGVEIADWRRS